MNSFSFVLVLGLIATPCLAVVHSGSKDAERREASLETSYGPPSSGPADVALPIAIYGQPAVNTYPPPPPDIPPPVQVPHKEYGVPVQQYGPPQVHVEFGPQPGGHHELIEQQHHEHHEHHQHQGQQEASFFDQVKQHFGIPKSNYGPPAANYGPPPHHHQARPKPSYGPPAQHIVYGPPKQTYNKPKPVYGPPQAHFHGPSPSYGPPARPSKPSNSYGPPPQIHRPAPAYGPPAQTHRPVQPTYQRPPPAQYGPPPTQHQHIPVAPLPAPSPLIHGNPAPETLPTPTRCEGWRPIAGPAIPYSNTEQQIHQEHISIDSSFGHHQEEATGYSNVIQAQEQYASGFGHEQSLEALALTAPAPAPAPAPVVAPVELGVSIQSTLTDGDLHLPVQNAINFYHDTAAGVHHSAKHSGSGSLNIGSEISNNNVHLTYGVPPQYASSSSQYAHNSQHSQQAQHSQHSQQSQHSHHAQHAQQSQQASINHHYHHHHHPSASTAGLIPPSGVYGVPPGGSYNGGLSLPQASSVAHFKQPSRPVLFRPPVPQGLIESIGHSVQQQDAFGTSYHSNAQSSVYLPPPASEIPPPPPGLESLPLGQGVAQLFHPSIDSAQALPYHQSEQRFNQHGTSLGSSNCGHGPSFGSASANGDQSFQVSSGYEAAKSSGHYESSQSTGFDISQNNIITGYDQPSLGLTVIQVNDEHSPTSSYGPPPSGIPNDSSAYETQHSVSSISASGDESHAHAEALTGSNNIQIITAINGDSHETASSEHRAQTHAASSHTVYAEHVTSIEDQKQEIKDAGITHEQQFLTQEQQYLTQQRNQQYIHQHQQEHSSHSGSLPGLDGAGLDIVSAQKSHSITIPVTGAQGSYQLQFQSAHGLTGGDSNDIDAPNHQQILSDGLLQQILSAIEQPGAKSDAVPQVSTYEELDAHSDVDQFIKSDIGKETLAEPKIQ